MQLSPKRLVIRLEGQQGRNYEWGRSPRAQSIGLRTRPTERHAVAGQTAVHPNFMTSTWPSGAPVRYAPRCAQLGLGLGGAAS